MAKQDRFKSFQDLAAHLKHDPETQVAPQTRKPAKPERRPTGARTDQSDGRVATQGSLHVGWWDEHRGTAVLHPSRPGEALVILDSGTPPDFKLVACDTRTLRSKLRPVGPPATMRALAVYADWMAGRVEDTATRVQKAEVAGERRRAAARAWDQAAEERRWRESQASAEEQRRRLAERTRAESERQERARRMADERRQREVAQRESRRQLIPPQCAQRGIEFLVHFTDARNLPAILSEGLLPLSDLKRRGAQVFVSDPERYDEHPDSISLSIEFPNYQMFYRKQNDDPAREWAVVGLHRSILWELRCAYFPDNAASREFRSTEDDEAPHRFLELFGDLDGVERSTVGIPAKYPTHPQSEVLAFERIPPEWIEFVHFKADSELFRRALALDAAAGQRVRIDKQYFDPRPDWSYWSERKHGQYQAAPAQVDDMDLPF